MWFHSGKVLDRVFKKLELGTSFHFWLLNLLSSLSVFNMLRGNHCEDTDLSFLTLFIQDPITENFYPYGFINSYFHCLWMFWPRLTFKTINRIPSIGFGKRYWLCRLSTTDWDKARRNHRLASTSGWDSKEHSLISMIEHHLKYPQPKTTHNAPPRIKF